MRTKRTDLLILAAVTLAVGTLIATDIAAEVRFSAAVRTPVVSVHVGSAPLGCRTVRQVRPLPARGRIHRTQRHDVIVAERLAWYTGVPAGEFLRYRRFGYSWYEIGQLLYVPGRVVRAAMNGESWQRYLHTAGYHDRRCGGYRHGKQCDAYCTVYEYRR